VHSHAPITVGDFDMTNPGYEILVANHDGYLDVYSSSNGNFLWNFSFGGPVGGCCASGYALLVDVNGDTCVELVVRGEGYIGQATWVPAIFRMTIRLR
jgi:outer membrane protein assembly factor BamB